jgi:hypothetical protein
LLIDFVLVRLPQRFHSIGKDRQIGIRRVKFFQRRANRFRTAIHLLGNPPSDLGRAATRLSHPPSAIDNLFAFLRSYLAETFATFDAVAVA